jgi:hypothetical protein
MPALASYPMPPGSASRRGRHVLALLIATWLLLPGVVLAQAATTPTPQGDALDKALEAEPAAEDPARDEDSSLSRREQEEQAKSTPYLPAPENGKRLSEKGRAWIDRDKGEVYVDGRISLRKGLLEMFACPPNTKEHESIVSVQSEAFVIHAGLLAVGAETGTPVVFTPEYKPPTGTKVEIDVIWKDKEGKEQKVRAQDWIRDARTKKAMELPWVFAGSGFWKNEELGTSGYLAEDGDLVCVANFSTAMLDVPAEMTNDNSGLLFEAWTERIPPLGWPVRLVFRPVLDDDAKKGDEKKNEPAKTEPATKPETKPEAKPATPAAGNPIPKPATAGQE